MRKDKEIEKLIISYYRSTCHERAMIELGAPAKVLDRQRRITRKRLERLASLGLPEKRVNYLVAKNQLQLEARELEVNQMLKCAHHLTHVVDNPESVTCCAIQPTGSCILCKYYRQATEAEEEEFRQRMEDE